MALCTICFSKHIAQLTDEEENLLCRVFIEYIGLQLPEGAGTCYICRHRLLRLDQFKRHCVETQNDISTDERRPQRFQNFIITRTLQIIIDPQLEYVQHPDIENETLDPETDRDNGCIISIVTHGVDISDTVDTIDDIGNYNDVKTDTEVENYSDVQDSNDNDTSYDYIKKESADIKESFKTEEVETSSVDNPEVEEPEPEIGFEKIVLSFEEQKAELEALRRGKKYLEAEFKCYNCALGFVLKDSYQSHMVRHEESNGQYSCGTCGLRFAQIGVRGMHVALHAERYLCRMCRATVTRARRRQHAARCHRQETAGCHHCGQMFQDTITLQQHLRRMHTRAGNKSYTCVLCSKTYRDSSALRVHMIKHSNQRFPCQRCPSSFNNPYSLNQHVAQHDGGQPVHCAPCDAWFKSRKTYRAHVRTTAKHRSDSYECPHCGRACATKQSLEGHVQTRHARDACHVCPLCSARYTSRKSLLKHIKTHGQAPTVKIAVCHLCGKSYKGQNKLNRHLREVCELKNLNEETGE